ncbi:hypothetical protein [Thiocystis violascens]|uniref:Uncharacterized protein n=1 Tax=Thiocystis violascens (strain ATCC 17096 / DSM 198 / 6111) TaxID=765911 RepID=I3YE21_THIV6|nr:hypothetical protein [Thiocystis violascens]AFL75239.1 hypothetical protein Thivi_3369 [Thiocystis violascens DSM 198]
MSKLIQAASILALAAAASTAGAWYTAPPQASAMTQAPQPAAVEQGAENFRPVTGRPFGAGHAFPDVPPMPEFGQYPVMPEMPAFGQFPNRPDMPPMPAFGQFSNRPDMPPMPEFGQHPAMPEMPAFGQFPNRPDMPPMPEFGQYPAMPEMPEMNRERPAMPEAFEARIKEMEARRAQAKQQMEERRAAMKSEQEQRRAQYAAHSFDAGRGMNANAPCAPATTSPSVQ